MKITADFTKITGKIKPMHGVGQPPMLGDNSFMFRYLEEAGIPYSRLHDVGGWFGKYIYVDIPNLFRDFDADVNDPASYDFAHTDWLIGELMKHGVEPFFRLGVTIENAHKIKAYRVFPPKDNKKWAEICEHVVRHYNEGWCDGFRYNIKYWEIWNEADDCFKDEDCSMWHGTPEEYFALYEAASKHLKKCFGDSIQVGGFASCGWWSGMEEDPDCTLYAGGKEADNLRGFYLEFAHKFFKYVKEHDCPMDYFSWHTYAQTMEMAKEHADYARKILNFYGFNDVPDICNEWNTNTDRFKRDSAEAASKAMAFMLDMQHREMVSVLCYYDARLGASVYGGLFNPDTWYPTKTYYSFRAFGDAYRLENEVFTATDDSDLYALGASKNGKNILLVTNNKPTEEWLEFDLKGVVPEDAEIIVTDDEYYFTLTGQKIKDGKLKVKAHSVLEIRF